MKKTISKLFVTILIALCGLCVSNVSYGQSKEYIEALNLYYKGQAQNAYAMFQKVIENEPENDAAYFYCAMLSRNPERAQSFLKKAVELDPNNFWYQYYLVISYGSSQDFDMAAMQIEKLIDQNPKRTSLYYDAVNIYLNKNDAAKALETLDIIEGKSGKSETLAITKVRLMHNLGQIDEAYKYLEEFYKEYQTPNIACLLGDYYASKYQGQRALELYDQAIAMDDSFTEAYLSKAMVHRALGQYDLFFENMKPFSQDRDIPVEAKVSVLDDVLSNPMFVQTFKPQVDTIILDMYESAPTDTLLCPAVAGYYYQTGRVDEALGVFRKCMEVHPDNAEMALTYTLILYYAEDWMEVINNATIALHKFPGNVELLQMRGIAFWNIEEYQSSIEDYNSIIALNPKDSANTLTAYSALGDLYYTVGNTKKSYDCYKKALKINPNYAPVLNNYAYYISEGYPKPVKKANKELKEALRMSRITIEQEPDNPTYLDTYAWLLHLTGQDIEAKALFKHAMIYGGKESAEVLNHYADVLDALGEHDLAKVQRTMARNLGFDEL
ncbi:MAG: tetratricopeptide repeat protein [Bacteroidales bacterium]|nr:tetratricopeptide repeat protein [Bacteroidales bacterium]